MISHETPADSLRKIPTKVIWIAVLSIVVLFGGLMTPWDLIKQLIADGGIGESGVQILAFIAGYTLPLTVGFAVVLFLYLTGLNRGHHIFTQILAVAVILLVAGFFSKALGVGLSPDYLANKTVNTPWWPVTLLLFVLSAYVNSYGIPLMISALAIGGGVALNIERMLKEEGKLTSSVTL